MALPSLEQVDSWKGHGQTNYVIQALGDLAEKVRNLSGERRDIDVDWFGKYSQTVLDGAPEFVMWENISKDLLTTLQTNSSAFPRRVFAYLEYASECENKVAEKALPLFAGRHTILTHCYSGVLVKSILMAASQPRNEDKLRVIIKETRPRLGGLTLMKELANGRLKMVYVVDSAIPTIIKEVDAIMVGADKVDPQGSVYNSIGTLSLCIVAKTYSKPVYVLCPSLKITEYRLSEETIKRYGPRQVTKIFDSAQSSEINDLVARGTLEVLNPLFDITPPSYITAFVTETGIVDADDARSGKLDLIRKDAIISP